ncbi:hypothetical protein Glove_188g5 [Diversispora epigaea]|uniref:DUF659 domain-containing protein n=1 Tax=Diversispora epigaea TaxID=1348612 RepID=A0A397ILG1_9GLOM|nr:hypothetical protein Glove_188g5 [Diversispora epigaea]
MAPLPFIIKEYIVKTNVNRIIAHFKKCTNFFNETTVEKREEIFTLLQINNINSTNTTNTQIGKRKELFSFKTSSSTSHGSKVIIRSSSYGTMDNYIVRPLSTADMKKFYTLLLRLSLSCSILSKTVKDSNNTMLKTLQEDQIGVTLTFDGTVILTFEGRPYVWKATDISSEHEIHIEVIEKTKELINELNNNKITVIAIVTDSASPYAASRRRLRVIEKAIVFLPCFAHQINLCTGEIFKESTEFKLVIDKDQQYEKYNKYFTIAAPGETHWNSYYYVCISILKTQKALQDPTLKREIYEIISSSIFWQHLSLLVEILHPYCKILNMLQSDKARLHEVIHKSTEFKLVIDKDQQYEKYNKYFTIAAPGETHWNSYYYVCISILKTQKALQDPTLKREIYEIISSSIFWQHLSLLVEILHPYCKILNMLQSDKARLHELGYYYNVWMGKQPKCILKELNNYHLEVYPFNSSTWNQFNSDIYRYWCFCCAFTNELGFVACRIFGICMNAASVERLRSCMGFLQSNRRNRLSNSKVLEMSKLQIESLKYNEEYLADNENPTDDENLQVIQDSQDPVKFDISMLEDESKGFDELDEIDDEEVENITHPAINLNAKWKLLSIFKELYKNN